MATFKLDEGHRLRSDSRQWILEALTQPKEPEDGEEAAQPAWKIVGYYTTLTMAIKASYNYLLRKSDADDIRSFMDDSNRILKAMTVALSPVAVITEL